MTPSLPTTEPRDPAITAALLRELCENIRHVRSERIWFGHIYVAVSTAGLAVLYSQTHTNWLQEVLVLLFLFVFSAVALLSSLRLVVELEEALARLDMLADEQGFSGVIKRGLTTSHFRSRMKLRWVFPVFYGLCALGFALLMVLRLTMPSLLGRG